MKLATICFICVLLPLHNSAQGLFTPETLISVKYHSAYLLPIHEAHESDKNLRYIPDSSFYYIYKTINRGVEDYITLASVRDRGLACPQWYITDFNTHVFKLKFSRPSNLGDDIPEHVKSRFYEISIADSGRRHNIFNKDIDNKGYVHINDDYSFQELDSFLSSIKLLVWISGDDVAFIAGDCIRTRELSWSRWGPAADGMNFNSDLWYARLKLLLYYQLPLNRDKLKFLSYSKRTVLFQYEDVTITVKLGEQEYFYLNDIYITAPKVQ